MATTDILFAGLITTGTTSSDSITTTTTDAAGRSGQLDLSKYRELLAIVQLKSLSGGTSPSIQVAIQTGDQQSGAAQQWNNLNTPPTAWTTTSGAEYVDSIGPGLTSTNDLGVIGRIAWTLTGAPTTCTFFVTVYGKD